MSKAKAVASTIRLVINAGQAKPSPPVGPALGQAGLKIMDFCKDFNAKTADIKARPARSRGGRAGAPPRADDVPIPVVITANADKTFSYVMKTPPASYFLKKAAGVPSGSGRPGHQAVATISLKHIHEIALVKQKDTPHVPLRSVCKSLLGSCRSMGIRVVARPEDA
eukprot:scaffold6.g2562.t1